MNEQSTSQYKWPTDPQPEFVYRYRATNLDRLKQIIIENELYFCSAIQVNDPFDSKVHLTFEGTKQERREFVKGLIREYHSRSPRKYRREMERSGLKSFSLLQSDTADKHLADFGICCFSTKNDDILMWSHYSDSHSGVCLQFRVNKESEPIFHVLFKVTYQQKFPTVSYLKDNPGVYMPKILLTKSQRWSYEDEWRILSTEGGPGAIKFNPKVLAGLIFGCRAGAQFKSTIIRLVEARPEIKLYQAKIREKEYELDIVPIS